MESRDQIRINPVEHQRARHSKADEDNKQRHDKQNRALLRRLVLHRQPRRQERGQSRNYSQDKMCNRERLRLPQREEPQKCALSHVGVAKDRSIQSPQNRQLDEHRKAAHNGVGSGLGVEFHRLFLDLLVIALVFRTYALDLRLHLHHDPLISKLPDEKRQDDKTNEQRHD